MSNVLSYLDCGCAILRDGGRTWCPTCESRGGGEGGGPEPKGLDVPDALNPRSAGSGFAGSTTDPSAPEPIKTCRCFCHDTMSVVYACANCDCATPLPASVTDYGEPWTQGRLIETARTREYEKWERDAAHAREQRLVFSHFMSEDEGASRRLVAEFRDPKELARALACVNAMRGIPDPAAYVRVARAMDDLLATMEGAMVYGKIGKSFDIAARRHDFRVAGGSV